MRKLFGSIGRYRKCLGLVLVLLAPHLLMALSRTPQTGATSVPGNESSVRHVETLADGWRTEFSTSPEQYSGFISENFDDAGWKRVAVPHNWQGYSYDRQDVHGSLHGSAWYRVRFRVKRQKRLERTLLMFEGVNAYATVWVNGRKVGTHAGGLTTFTLDVTQAIRFDRPNLLCVRADDPRHIHDLPWVSGDDSDILGFAEGSQPLGVFRPVHVIQTSAVRLTPFGVNVWNSAELPEHAARLHTTAELCNAGISSQALSVRTEVLDAQGAVVSRAVRVVSLAPGQQTVVEQQLPAILEPHLWSPEHPYLYRVHTAVLRAGVVIDDVFTDTGVRWIQWPVDAGGNIIPGPFLLNGKPFPIRGIAEYEHLLGGSHAFSPQEIATRVHMVEAAGFNAFRDAHYPHNLRYADSWARDGILWWPQFSAHIYFDDPSFRANFKALLADWVRERRTNPAVILWGLQNESVLPTDFARESVELIRSLDPTASRERKVTTCNFGTGTDWNVPQNWSGTYGGDVKHYAQELKKEVLVGEYGAWRSLGFHADPVDSLATKALTEERMLAVMEQKVQLADSVAGDSAGQFAWLLLTHENPGRLMRKDGTQIFDGIRDLQHIGPANNKGLFTIWGEPLDAFYMYRSNYVPATRSPMVYLAAHTWPDRWESPSSLHTIVGYSNCDEVELFNGPGGRSLGVRTRQGIGTHFTWKIAALSSNLLYAEGRLRGKVVATDEVRLLGLPEAQNDAGVKPESTDLLQPAQGYTYLYRVHAGGPDYTDQHGHRWFADQHYEDGTGWGFTSWADRYPTLDPELGSRGVLYDPVQGTADPELFRTYRFGRDQLAYKFRVPNGHYRVELYFVEPWFGRAGIDASGWRQFDVAINGQTRLRDVDVWKHAGFAHAWKQVLEAEVRDQSLVITFPRVASSQAIVSAIAIGLRSGGNSAVAAQKQSHLLQVDSAGRAEVRRYLDFGDRLYSDSEERLVSAPAELLDADWIARPSTDRTRLTVTASRNTTVFLLRSTQWDAPGAEWQPLSSQAQTVISSRPNASERYDVYRRKLNAGAQLTLDTANSQPDGKPADVLAFKREVLSPFAPEQGPHARTVYSALRATVQGGSATGAPLSGEHDPSVQLGPSAARVAWNIYVGVSGSYRFSMPYAVGAHEQFGTFRILDSAGNEVDSAPLRMADDPGKAKQVLNVTVTLNAGNYTVEVRVPQPDHLALGSLTVD